MSAAEIAQASATTSGSRFFEDGQRLRCREMGTDDCRRLLPEVDPDQASDFFKLQSVALNLPTMAFAHSSQNIGCADIGMTGKRQFGARCEFPHLCRVLGPLRRQDEGCLRQVELGAIACICRVDNSVPSATTASGLPPNCRSVKTSTVANFTCMTLWHSVAIPNSCGR